MAKFVNKSIAEHQFADLCSTNLPMAGLFRLALAPGRVATANDQLLDFAALIRIDGHRESLFAGAQTDFRDGFLTGQKTLLARTGFQNESFEVAKAVKDDFCISSRHAAFLAAGALPIRGNAQLRRWDGRRVAAKSRDAPTYVRNKTGQDWIPTVGRRHVLLPPFQDGQRVFLLMQKRLIRGHGYLHLKGAGDVPPVVHFSAVRGAGASPLLLARSGNGDYRGDLP